MDIKLDYDSGVYLLEIFLHKPNKIEIGALGVQTFPAGYYYYSGTAQKNLQARLKRHLSKDKNFHWHIDFLLAEGHIQNYYTWPLDRLAECKLSAYLEDDLDGKIIVPGFGASDCSCETHLIYFEDSLEKSQLDQFNLAAGSED